MTARKQKQIAYNERVLQAEDEIAGINCDIADFLSGMSSTGTIPVCINAGASMKRNEKILGGQLWLQEGQSVTAVNGTLEGMPNTRESAILAAAVEAVEWKHPIEPISADGKRQASRAFSYPAEMPQLEEAMKEFLSNPSEQEDGSHIAFWRIIGKCAEYESSPRFYREDSDAIRSDPELAAAVPVWSNTAAQVSVGSRDLVLEDGPDTMNSSDEESPKKEHGEVLTGMYTERLKAPILISQSETARQKAAWSYAESQGYSAQINSDQASSAGGEFSDSDLPAPTMRRSRFETSGPSESAQRSSNPFVPRPVTPTGSAPSRPATPSGNVPSRPSTPTVSVPPDPPSPKRKSGLKAATLRGAPAESEHPMTIWSKKSKTASRAGGLRPVGGSGKTDTCVASSHPSQT
jgi:hypothetical protein